MPEPVHYAALLLGSNLGESEKNLTAAVSLLKARAGKIIRASSIYATAPWGFTEQPDFLNQAVLLQTVLSPVRLLTEILATEKELGRERLEKWGPRVIDIDILYYDDRVMTEPELKIPHPYLAERRFSLLPLAEISPGWMHPVLRLSVDEMLMRCPDHSEVKKLRP